MPRKSSSKGKPSSLYVIEGKETQIMHYLFHVKVATADQINRDVFKSSDLSYCFKKIRKLEKLEYLQRKYIKLGMRAKSTFHLTKKAYHEFITHENKNDLKKRIFSSSIEHDIQLVDIRYSFKRCKTVLDYNAENFLHSGAGYIDSLGVEDILRINSDALIQLKGSTQDYFFTIEYEANLKFHSRVKQKITQYYKTKRLAGVFYILKNEQIMKSLIAIEKSNFDSHEPKIFYALLDNVKNHDGNMHFIDRNGEKLTIK